jgi:hypothetical protein
MIDRMGDKASAKATMKQGAVVPGSVGILVIRTSARVGTIFWLQ